MVFILLVRKLSLSTWPKVKQLLNKSRNLAPGLSNPKILIYIHSLQVVIIPPFNLLSSMALDMWD